MDKSLPSEGGAEGKSTHGGRILVKGWKARPRTCVNPVPCGLPWGGGGGGGGGQARRPRRGKTREGGEGETGGKEVG